MTTVTANRRASIDCTVVAGTGVLSNTDVSLSFRPSESPSRFLVAILLARGSFLGYESADPKDPIMKSRPLQLMVAAALFMFCSQASASLLCVDLNSTNPLPPYTNWATAATVIQDAVDAANPGDTVLVNDGVYATGGRRLSAPDVTNRVAVTNGLIVRSVNGPAVTFIQGYGVSSFNALTNAIRCAFLGSNVALSGFTLTNGSAGTGNYVNGGGLLCDRGPTTVVSNCILVGNYAAGGGGGACNGTFVNCIFRGNLGQGGAAIDATLLNCTVTNNSGGWAGGALGCIATNCLFAGNHATNYGGASGFSTLVNCTLVSNSLQTGSGGNGGGSYKDMVYNSIIYGNTAPNGSNYYSSSIAWSCTAPLPPGAGNFTNAPTFVDPMAGNLHSQSNSSCINAGRNTCVTTATDLDGNPRISGGTVDVGAYEFQGPASKLAYYWLQNFNLPTDGSADFIDTDNDGMNNWQEWRAGTIPTDALSFLKLSSPAGAVSGITVSWQSVSGLSYFLQRSTSVSVQPSFLSIQSNIVGQVGTTSFNDTNAVGPGPFFYRVGVQWGLYPEKNFPAVHPKEYEPKDQQHRGPVKQRFVSIAKQPERIGAEMRGKAARNETVE
jgi:hypothetical protein